MIKVVKAKYLSACDSCHSDCTYLVRADKIYPKYLHLCTPCLLKLKQQLCARAKLSDGGTDGSQEQVEQ